MSTTNVFFLFFSRCSGSDLSGDMYVLKYFTSVWKIFGIGQSWLWPAASGRTAVSNCWNTNNISLGTVRRGHFHSSPHIQGPSVPLVDPRESPRTWGTVACVIVWNIFLWTHEIFFTRESYNTDSAAQDVCQCPASLARRWFAAHANHWPRPPRGVATLPVCLICVVDWSPTPSRKLPRNLICEDTSQ